MQAEAKASLDRTGPEALGLFIPSSGVFLNFLERLEFREDSIPDGRGEVVFYNLGKFSQLISDFETIHYHSKPAEKYESFCGLPPISRRETPILRAGRTTSTPTPTPSGS